MTNQRLIPVAIEPRSVLAEYNPGYNCFTVHSSTQVPHALGGAISKTFGMRSTEVRVIAPEVGGGFGSKLNVYSDEILVSFAAKTLGLPVKWTETRREAAGSTIHGRGWIGTATLVGTKDGQFLGYKLDALADMGAYTQNFTVANASSCRRRWAANGLLPLFLCSLLLHDLCPVHEGEGQG
jgi:carbon-monoxide dehydrogenase large subunit